MAINENVERPLFETAYREIWNLREDSTFNDRQTGNYLKPEVEGAWRVWITSKEQTQEELKKILQSLMIKITWKCGPICLMIFA